MTTEESTSFDNLPNKFKHYIAKVYGLITICVLFMGICAYMDIFCNIGGELTYMGSMISPIIIQNKKIRFKIRVFTFFLGVSFIGFTSSEYILDIIKQYGIQHLYLTLLFTTAIFASFSGSAMFYRTLRALKYREFMLLILSAFIIFKTFFYNIERIEMLLAIIILFGLCIYVIYDTQAMVKQFYDGNGDIIVSVTLLFQDFVSIAAMVSILLSSKNNIQGVKVV